jgi:predicted MFS family arabinose efflux permease
MNPSLFALNALNFFMADVAGGLGPFLGVFLQAKHWSPAEIGVVMTIGGIAGMAVTTPLGALVDRTRAKRAMVVAAAVAITLASIAILLRSGFVVVAAAQVVNGIAGAAVGCGHHHCRAGDDDADGIAGGVDCRKAGLLAGVPARADRAADPRRDGVAGDRAMGLAPVQILDGVGAGILGVAVPGLVARILAGTGHVNAGLGVVMTLQAVGAALSTTVGGLFAQLLGYSAAFLALGAIAALMAPTCANHIDDAEAEVAA